MNLLGFQEVHLEFACKLQNYKKPGANFKIKKVKGQVNVCCLTKGISWVYLLKTNLRRKNGF